jgi:hypothetical protein
VRFAPPLPRTIDRRPKCRPPNLTAQHRHVMAQDDNLKFLELGRSEQQEDQLQNALKRDVKSR